MGGRRHGLGDDDETIIVGKMTLSEIVTRRARDYGLERAEDLAAAMGMSYQHARCLMNGQLRNVSIDGRRALVRALDLDPGVIERAVRKC